MKLQTELLSHTIIVWCKRYIMAAVLAVSLPSAVSADDLGGRPSVLFIGKPGDYLETEYLDELQARGFEVDAGRWDDVNPRTLRRYHAIVVTGYGTTAYAMRDLSQPFTPDHQRYVEEYMRAGGGVLFVLNTMASYVEIEGFKEVQAFLKKFGIDFYTEAINDPGTETPMSPTALQRYGLRAALAKPVDGGHPIVAGVEHLWYPVGWGGHAAAAATPVNHSHQWTPLIKTSDTAGLVVQEQIPGHLWRRERPEGPYTLMAARDVDAGRMAVLGVNPMWTIWSPYYPPLGQIIMKRGEKGVPSDFAQLLENTYAWLAEPSLIANIYGLEVAKRPPVPGDTPPIAWDLIDFPERPSRYYRGVVGAHTAFSTGTGSVAEWAEAAKRNGFDFLIFTEDLANMDREKWERLQADCIAVSDADFIAYAGMQFRNARGNRGFLPWGNERPWFPDGYLTADGKRINVDRGWSPQKGHGATDHKSGQIMIWLEHKSTGFFAHDHNEAPFWDYKLYNLFTVWSYEDKQPLDDALDKLLHANSLHVNPAPYALDLLYHPGDLDSAAKGGRPFLVVAADDDPRLPEAATLESVFKRFVVGEPAVTPHLIYRTWVGPVATQGPKLRLMFRGGYRWMGVEFPRYWIERHQGIETGDWFMDSWYRIKVRLDAESEVGLKDIALYDGETVIRRFDPQGATTFTVEFDLLQDQNRHLAAVVTDQNGHQAVSREIWTEQQQNLYNYCGDRVNVPLSIYSPIHGHPYWRTIMLKRGRLDKDALRAARVPRDEVRRFFVDLVSPDVLIERYKTDRVYKWEELSDQHGWHNWAPHHERDDYTFEQRGFAYYNKHGRQVSFKDHLSQRVYWDGFGEATADLRGEEYADLHVFENKLTLKQPLELDDDGFFGKTVIVFQAPDALEYTLIKPDGEWMRGVVAAGAESAVLPIPSGSVLTMQAEEGGESILWEGDDLAVRIAWHEGRAMVESGLRIGDRNRAGESFVWRFQRIDRAVAPGQVLNPEWFTLHRGELMGLPLLSELHVTAENGAAGILLKEAAFDSNMQPIIVHGVSARNSVFLYHKGQRLIRPVGVYDGKAYAQVPATLKDEDLVIGHLLTADHNQLHITAVRETDHQGSPTGVWLVEVHNPTDREITAHITPSPAFGLLETGERTVTVKPGSSVDLKVNERP